MDLKNDSKTEMEFISKSETEMKSVSKSVFIFINLIEYKSFFG